MFTEKLLSIKNKVTEKDAKRLQVDLLIRLNDKVKNDEIVEGLLSKIVDKAEAALTSKMTFKTYNNEVKELKTYVEKIYKLKDKETIQSEYTSLGMSIGVVIGIIMMKSSPAFLAIGIGVGLSIGTGIGIQKAKDLEKKGLTY